MKAEYKPIEIYFAKDDIKDEISRFLKYSEADFCILYFFNGNLAVRLLAIAVDKHLNYNFSEFIDFDLTHNILYEVYTTGRTLENTILSSDTLVKGASKEWYFPLVFRDKVIGVICIGTFEEKDLNVDIRKLQEIVNNNIYLLLMLSYKKFGYKGLIDIIILIHEIFSEKSPFMVTHIYNVAAWAVQIARKLGYSDEELTEIYLAALMHDIGKIFVNMDIINKKGKLTEKEFEEVKKHVDIGYMLAREMFLFDQNSPIPLWIYQHHEKWDGTGYPKGIKGADIFREARILKIADALDAILSDRSYKKSMRLDEAIAEIKRCRGTDFDPEIADVAIEILGKKLNYYTYDIFEDVVLPATVVVKNSKEFYSYEGIITKIDNELVFNSAYLIEGLENDKLYEFNLVLEKFNMIFEYVAQGKKVEKNKIVFQYISPYETKSSFGLLWLLPGHIVFSDIKEAHEITITRISGEGLVFCFPEKEYKLDMNKIYIVVPYFDDGTRVPLPGRIIEKLKVGQKIHYKFSFVGLKENHKDEVFRQIFRKEISLRKVLNN
ncbi:HD domain-containing phosphohydrolase [Thermosyntropha sp.]|uniref:HD domain-containing phosphohydrolase n=1 Tax=Thermosyntropha sp. TaxID=2740820 RepID=UPI0025EC462D|nr:HD domain-containing phosphohydrolase [Thermosyntropha sp.]MBO8158542.1 HD domain-containing protein [Thermosyntropha sp.]